MRDGARARKPTAISLGASAATGRYWRRMPGWFQRLFPAKTLAGVKAPTAVRVDARVLTPNTLVSPLSGQPAALIGWRFFTHFHDHSGQQPKELYRLLLSCARGGDMMLG